MFIFDFSSVPQLSYTSICVNLIFYLNLPFASSKRKMKKILPYIDLLSFHNLFVNVKRNKKLQ